jgi:hypothetical protein
MMNEKEVLQRLNTTGRKTLTLKMRCSCSSTVPPGNMGLPVAISKNIHPTPLGRQKQN